MLFRSVDGVVDLDFYRAALEPQQVDQPFRLGRRVLDVDTSHRGDPAPVIAWVRDHVAELSQRR